MHKACMKSASFAFLAPHGSVSLCLKVLEAVCRDGIWASLIPLSFSLCSENHSPDRDHSLTATLSAHVISRALWPTTLQHFSWPNPGLS